MSLDFFISFSLSIYLLIFLPTFPLGITSRSLKMQEYGPISWLQTICPAGSQCFSHFSCLVYYIFPPAISIRMPLVTTCTHMVIILISTQFILTSPYFFIFCPILISCILLTVLQHSKINKTCLGIWLDECRSSCCSVSDTHSPSSYTRGEILDSSVTED